MSSAWFTLVAALGGAVVGGGITLVGQALDANRRAKGDELARLVAILSDVAEGATAVRLQDGKQNRHNLRSALLKLVLSGPPDVARVADEWLTAVDEVLIGRGDLGQYVEVAQVLERRMIDVARPVGR